VWEHIKAVHKEMVTDMEKLGGDESEAANERGHDDWGSDGRRRGMPMPRLWIDILHRAELELLFWTDAPS
jgi:hypothetical protein